MRSCIYCGRELEKGEVCTCPQSAKFRAGKEKKSSSESNQSSGAEQKEENASSEQAQAENAGKKEQKNSYHTGYTGNESRVKQAWNRGRAKRQAAKAAKSGTRTKEFARSFAAVLLDSVKAPVKAIENAHNIGPLSMLLLAALQGASIWLCMYFVFTNIKRGPFAFLASLMAFNGAAGYHNLLYMLMTAVSGAVSGVIMFFLYTGIFFLINKYIFRIKSRYWDFSQRLALAGIPLIIVCIAGIFFSMISQVTLMILLLCGGAGWIVLTYEALRAEWYTQTPDKVVYSMLLGLLVFFMILCQLMRLG